MGFSNKMKEHMMNQGQPDNKALNLGQSLLDAKDRLMERERRKQGMESTLLTRGSNPVSSIHYATRHTLG